MCVQVTVGVENPPVNAGGVWKEVWVPSLGQEDPLEKGMATHSSILPGESHGQRNLVAIVHRVRKYQT